MDRIYHTWDKWECYPAGFYETKYNGYTDEECKQMYSVFLADIPRFKKAMRRVTEEWPNSCEHYLTNEGMNRIAWLGQAAACIDIGLPSRYRSGYYLLSKKQQKEANMAALEHLNEWLVTHGDNEILLEQAGVNAKVNLY